MRAPPIRATHRWLSAKRRRGAMRRTLRALMSRLQIYVVTAPGLESVTAREMAKLDMKVIDLGIGGLTSSVTWSQLMLAHLHLRTATRVLVRLARFEAGGFGDLKEGMSAIPLHEWLPRHAALNINVSATGSRLTHTD